MPRHDVSNPYQTASPVKPAVKTKEKRKLSERKAKEKEKELEKVKEEKKLKEGVPSPKAIIEATVPKVCHSLIVRCRELTDILFRVPNAVDLLRT